MSETPASSLVAARTLYRGEALAAQATGEVGEVRLRLSGSLYWLSLLLLIAMTGLIYRALTHPVVLAQGTDCAASAAHPQKPEPDKTACHRSAPRTVQPVADIVSRLKQS